MKVSVKKMIKVALVLAIFGGCIWWSGQNKEALSKKDFVQPDIILDAGHGGEDGGAISISSKKESDLNLQITLKVDQIIGLLGKQAVLMRDEDISLHDSTAVTLREKKRSDLKKRVETAGRYPESLLVSIHQNSYQDSQYWGTQTFYSTNDGSMELAKELQAAVQKYLQLSNTRKAKPIPSSVFLMNHITNRAVLVECGFLTNPKDDKLLQQQPYQKKLALILGTTLVIK